jgi:hypothetical protein
MSKPVRIGKVLGGMSVRDFALAAEKAARLARAEERTRLMEMEARRASFALRSAQREELLRMGRPEYGNVVAARIKEWKYKRWRENREWERDWWEKRWQKWREEREAVYQALTPDPSPVGEGSELTCF